MSIQRHRRWWLVTGSAYDITHTSACIHDSNECPMVVLLFSVPGNPSKSGGFKAISWHGAKNSGGQLTRLTRRLRGLCTNNFDSSITKTLNMCRNITRGHSYKLSKLLCSELYYSGRIVNAWKRLPGIYFNEQRWCYLNVILHLWNSISDCRVGPSVCL